MSVVRDCNGSEIKIGQIVKIGYGQGNFFVKDLDLIQDIVLIENKNGAECPFPSTSLKIVGMIEINFTFNGEIK